MSNKDRSLTYWQFVYNFRQWRFGKWSMTAGLIVNALFLGFMLGTPWDELWAWGVKVFCVGALGAIYGYGLRRNFNGRQA